MITARMIDTGLRSARWNLAMTAALAALHPAGEGAVTLRFQRFPPSVLIGRHQVLAREVRVDRCRAQGIEIARRATGGGAVYMDAGIIAWDVVADRKQFGGRLERAAERICTGVAAGLHRLGVEARFQPPNVVTAGGRKLCGASGAFDGSVLVFQGTVLIDFDIAAMASVLVATRDDAAALADRVTSLAALCGHKPSTDAVTNAISAGLAERLGVAFAPAAPTQAEVDLADSLLTDSFGADAFVAGEDEAA